MNKSINEVSSLWKENNQRDAVSRAIYLTTMMELDIMTLCEAENPVRNAINNLAGKRQMILNLLAPYGDENDVSDSFHSNVQALFNKEDNREDSLILMTQKWTELQFGELLRINSEKAITKNNNGPVAELDGKIADLEQEVLKRARARQDCDDLGKEVIRPRKEKYQLQLEDASKETLRQKIVEQETVLAGINGKVEEYEDALVRKLIERITVYDDYYTVEFKSGIEIDVRL